MKSTYVLTVETNLTKMLRGDCEVKVYEKDIKVFTDFESAKTGMRSIIKEFATTKNDIFDGNGSIIGFDEEFECAVEEAKFFDYSESAFEYINNIPQILKSYFLGDEVSFSDIFYEEFLTCDFEMSDDCSGWSDIPLKLTGEFCLPFRLYGNFNPPLMQINTFDMSDPDKTYVIRIRSACEEWDQTAFIYLELRKVNVE